MVGRKRRRLPKQPLLRSHQKCWLWGRHAVLEALRAGHWRPVEVWLAQGLPEPIAADARGRADQWSIAVYVKSDEELTRRCGKREHQGLMARMPPFPYADVDAVLGAATRPELFLILDGVEDPHNFGAILRSADVFGAGAVFIGTRRQCEVTSHVARSSAGGVNYVPVARTEDLAPVIGTLRSRGVQMVAASERGERSAAACNFTLATALIIGGEGRGVSAELLSLCDVVAAIPQAGHVPSLNAAVAAGILLYEVRRQRDAAALH
jgi:23S rRNA (guanosine2251-2'-O)-methyltransferase